MNANRIRWSYQRDKTIAAIDAVLLHIIRKTSCQVPDLTSKLASCYNDIARHFFRHI